MKKDNIFSLISLSFGKGYKSIDLPIVTLTQGSKRFNFIVDTGSNRNNLDKAALKDLEHIKVEDSEDTHVIGVGGAQEVEHCKATLESQGEKIEINFCVADFSNPFLQMEEEHGIPLHGLLGSEFIREHNLILDFQKMMVYSRKPENHEDENPEQ